MSEAIGSAVNTESDAPVAQLDGLRVLIAEDNSVNQLLVESMLAGLGATYETVEDGAAAVAAVQSQTFDVILMDCLMPNMDGFEATRTIRSQGVDIPIIAATASASAGDFEEARESGMNDVLVKPFSAVDLRRMLLNYVNVATSKEQESDDRALINDDTRGFVKIVSDPATGVVLGGSIVGRHAAELISVLAVAVTNGLTVSDIHESLLVHPTLAEALSEAAE